jgi:nucleoid-associated protein EbfC
MSQSDSSPLSGLSSAGGFDIGALLSQAQALQSQLQDAQAKAAETEIEGNAGGGKVRIQMNGTGAVKAISIDPSVVDPKDVEMLEDLILAAFHDGAGQVAALNHETMGGVTSGLGLGDMGGLGGLLG